MFVKRYLLLFVFFPLTIIGQVEVKDLEILPENLQDAIEKKENQIEDELPESIRDLVSSAIIEESKIWNEGVLKVSFKGGNSKIRKLIAEAAVLWTDYGDITFDFGYDPTKGTFRSWKPQDSSHIRIGFKYSGNWSLIGNQSVDWRIIPKGQISLNFHKDTFGVGKFPDNGKSTVLHEFGHALGFKHEHQYPDLECDFDWPTVYRVLEKKPNEWSKKRVDRNLRKLQERGLTFTDYDKKSIMHYSLPAWMFKSKTNSTCYIKKKNTELSKDDKKMMGKIYPKNRNKYIEQRKNLAQKFEKIIQVDSTIVSNEFFDNKVDYFSKEWEENNKYIIGMQGLRVNEEKYSIFTDFIRNKGYTINLNNNYKENKSWLAKTSIVLFYSKNNRKKAKQIALELSKITGQNFEIGMGKGIAVFNEEKQFYIHWIAEE